MRSPTSTRLPPPVTVRLSRLVDQLCPVVRTLVSVTVRSAQTGVLLRAAGGRVVAAPDGLAVGAGVRFEAGADGGENAEAEGDGATETAAEG